MRWGGVFSRLFSESPNQKVRKLFLLRIKNKKLESKAQIWFESFEDSLKEKPPDKEDIYLLSGILFDTFQNWVILKKKMKMKLEYIQFRQFDDPVERLLQIHWDYTRFLGAYLQKYSEEQWILYFRVILPDAPVNRI